MVVHIDDCYVVGTKEAVNHLVKQLHHKGLKTKISHDATDYLSCEIKLNKERTRAWIGQPTLINKLMKKFGEKVQDMGNYNYKTPGTPGYSLQKPDSDIGILTPEEQTNYRSGVGTLLQFANKTRPDIANSARELSRGMDKATKAAEKEMYRVIKYVLQTKDYGLKIEPKGKIEKGKWQMTMYSDSDWATNKTDRKSITGFVLYFQGTLILWKSQAQKTVALSSTEAEYYAMSEATKEIKFVLQVLESMGIQVLKPIIVHIDNVGAIFVAETPSATKHTRHIDARYHFVREYIIDGTIKIIFVSSNENKADLLTKNVISEIYEKHIDDFIIHQEQIELTSNELEQYCYFDSGGVLEYVGRNKDESCSNTSTNTSSESRDINKSTCSKNNRKITSTTNTSTRINDDQENIRTGKEISDNTYKYQPGIRMGEDGRQYYDYRKNPDRTINYGHTTYNSTKSTSMYNGHKNKVKSKYKAISNMREEKYENRGNPNPYK